MADKGWQLAFPPDARTGTSLKQSHSQSQNNSWKSSSRATATLHAHRTRCAHKQQHFICFGLKQLPRLHACDRQIENSSTLAAFAPKTRYTSKLSQETPTAFTMVPRSEPQLHVELASSSKSMCECLCDIVFASNSGWTFCLGSFRPRPLPWAASLRCSRPSSRHPCSLIPSNIFIVKHLIPPLASSQPLAWSQPSLHPKPKPPLSPARFLQWRVGAPGNGGSTLPVHLSTMITGRQIQMLIWCFHMPLSPQMLCSEPSQLPGWGLSARKSIPATPQSWVLPWPWHCPAGTA